MTTLTCCYLTELGVGFLGKVEVYPKWMDCCRFPMLRGKNKKKSRKLIQIIGHTFYDIFMLCYVIENPFLYKSYK